MISQIERSLNLTGPQANAIRRVIRDLRNPLSHRLWKATPFHEKMMFLSAFPDTGRLIWFCPTVQGGICVIEVPTDDPSPTTMLHILMRPASAGGWYEYKSPKAYDHWERTSKLLPGCVPNDPERYYVLEYATLPCDVRTDGKQREHLQLHALTSTTRCQEQRRADPVSGGAFCSTTYGFGTDENSGKITSNHPASKGCGFVTDPARLTSVWLNNGKEQHPAMLHVGACANTFFSTLNDRQGVLKLFNLDDPQFIAEVNSLVDDPATLDYLRYYSDKVIQVYG